MALDFRSILWKADKKANGRMWRKTRSRHSSSIPNQFSQCIGVDPNRNFGYEWGRTGASASPCDETYKGPSAFSEPETHNIKNFILAQNQQIQAYITFHSYGQDFVYPWGYKGCEPGSLSDEADLKDVAQTSARAILHSSGGLGSQYTVGSSGCSIYPAAGGSDDWAKGRAGIKYAYTVELPDDGRYGFILPASRIEPVSVETFEGIKALAIRVKVKEGL